MKNLLLFVLIFSAACSSKKKDEVYAPKAQYLKIHGSFGDQNYICEEHRINIIQPAISGEPRKIKNPKSKDKLNFFIQNEKKALFSIESFDVKKLGREATKAEYNFANSNCLSLNNDLPAPCNSVFVSMDYFHGLIIAMKHNRWSKSTVNKAKELALSFVRELSSNEPSLLDIAIANEVIFRLAENGFLTSALSKDAVALRDEMVVTSKALRDQYEAAAAKSDCEAFKKAFAFEIQKAAEFTQKFISNTAP